MEQNFKTEQSYIRAKKRVKEIKGFYTHLVVFIVINLFISGTAIYGNLRSGDSLVEAISGFGVYSTFLFWGIGMFFHWLSVFGFKSIGFGRDWEERKIKEYMEKENDLYKKVNR
ncbi:MAG: 2TM domain-containing protein [Polaribacter sp.]|nr:2TM domain-containing protein [Polaribacter sp.]